MKRHDLRMKIWAALQPVLEEYRAKNHCSKHKALVAMTVEVRGVFPIIRGVRFRKNKSAPKLRTNSEWLDSKKQVQLPRFSVRSITSLFSKQGGRA